MALTRFEKARLLATRSLQISQGAPSQVAVDCPLEPYEAALRELEAGDLPLAPRRFRHDSD